MTAKEEVRRLESIVDDGFDGLSNLKDAASGLVGIYRKFEESFANVRTIVENATDDGGRLLRSKLDRESMRSSIGILEALVLDTEWSNEELCLAIATLKSDVAFLAAAVDA